MRTVVTGRALWIALALAAIILVIYAPVRQHEFLSTWDDPLYISENPDVLKGLSWQGLWWALTTNHAPYWHPLTWLSHMLDVQIYGIQPGGHHLTSVFLHIANTLLFFALLVRITGALYRSAFAAALFGVHPLRVESVAWITERKDVLSGLFWILALWAYVAYVRQPRLSRYLLVCLLFVFGLMAKPMVVTLPVALLLMDYWPLVRTNAASFPNWFTAWAPLVREKLPLFALAGAVSALTFVIQQRIGAVASLGTFPLELRLANAPLAYLAYIGKMLWPARLAGFYPYPPSIPAWQVILAVGILIGISVAAVRAMPRHPYVVVGWVWYVATLLPVIGLFQAGEQSMADRFTHIPLIGLFVIAAWGVPDLLAGWPHSRITLWVVGLLVVAACAVAAGYQTRFWKSDLTLWTRVLEVNPRSHISQNNMGDALLAQGRAEEAIAYYREAARLNPRFATAPNNLGNALLAIGKPGEAVTYYREAVRINPEFLQARDNLGIVLFKQGRLDEAAGELSEALRINPEFAEAHNDLAAVLNQQGRIDEAAAHYRQAIRIKPSYALAHANLGGVLAQQGRTEEAIREFSAAVDINPNEPSFHYNLGAALNTKGDTTSALMQFQFALKLKPGDPQAQRAVQILSSRDPGVGSGAGKR